MSGDQRCRACELPITPSDRTVASDLDGSQIHRVCPIFGPPIRRIGRLLCYSCGTTYAAAVGRLGVDCPTCGSDSYREVS